ncbi:MAG: HAMP domain-containing protein [Clostridia bacterium]|nr:HAMP domain-containing protein [Clostridia bacterium]
MFRSLHMKLVLVLVLLIISVMIVVGTFLINSVAEYNIDDFREQMSSVFTPELILTLEKHAAGEHGAVSVQEILEAYSTQLGIDSNRAFYVLDPFSGKYLSGSDDSLAGALEITPNIVSAISGEVGQDIRKLDGSFDVAIPLKDEAGEVRFIVGVRDNKAELNDLTWNLFSILMRAMFFGLIAAILLSILLSKTITTPIERLTSQASRIAAGDFGDKAQIYSTDEIGVLTETFNNMAEVLEHTLEEIDGERNKLDTLFRHMADGVAAFDADGALLHVNPAAEQMLGRSLSIGTPYEEIFPNLYIEKDDIESDGKFIEVDYSAGARMLKIFFAPLRLTETANGLMAVLHDITEQQKLDESRREFVANVSHELRTPLTNIKGYTDTLIESDDLDKDTEKRFLGVISGETDRMARIVKDLLTLTRLDYNRMEMSMEPTDLRAITLGIKEAMQIDAENHELTLTQELPDKLPAVMADKARIEQVITNIVSNAVKYNRPGGSVNISAAVSDAQVDIIVRDTGIGIPKEDLPRIFERFYRVDKARSRASGGTGLGLAISREIMLQHGGDILFDSVFGEGSTVTLRFPRADAKGEAK